MVLIFTYKDKGQATKLVYPSNQRPMSKFDAIQNIPGKPNPIKQWRKQLQPSVGDPVQSHATIQALENAVFTQTINDGCIGHADILFIDECDGIKDDENCRKGSFYVRRSANTIINKDFCWNSKQYLQRRCKTYEQNQTLGEHVNGSEYYGASCTRDGDNVCKPVIYKPNNKQFKQQGGVSSSARIAKLKYETIVNSTNKYDSLLANLDSSTHILNRKPTPCRGWKVRGKRYYDKNAICQNTSTNNI